MSRMLNALQQIEARSGRLSVAPELPSGMLPADGRDPSASEAGMLSVSESLQAHDRTLDAIESTLDRVEAAAALVDVPPEVPLEDLPLEDSLSDAPPDAEPKAEEGPIARWPQPASEPESRAYADLAASILAQLPEGPAALLLISPGQLAGRSEMSMLLAATLAQRTSKETLVVDGDMQRATLTRRLRAEVRWGLDDVLTGRTDWPSTVIRADKPRLWAIPATARSVGDPQVDVFSQVGPLLDELTDRYALVLLDAQSASTTELGRLVGHCAGMYLAVGLKQSACGSVRRTAEAAQTSGLPLLGSMVIR